MERECGEQNHLTYLMKKNSLMDATEMNWVGLSPYDQISPGMTVDKN